MKTPTIYDIKYDIQAKSSHFFDIKTMKFFGQTMKDFSVRQSATGRIFIYAPIYDKHNFGIEKLMGYTFREYIDHDLVNVHNDDGSLLNHDNLADIYEFISAH